MNKIDETGTDERPPPDNRLSPPAREGIFLPFHSGVFYVVTTVGLTALLFIVNNWHPIHDAVNWFPFFDYFQNSLLEGRLPLWNPFSNLGMPFFQNIQPLGMLEPIILLTTPLQLINGLPPVDLHVIRMFSRFLVFIAGAYWTLKILTNDTKLSAILSIILFVGLLPSGMRQTGMIDNNMFVPLVIAISLLYFRASTPARKGWLFVSLCFVLGVMVNNHIPVIPLYFFLIFFFMYAHYLGGGLVPTLTEPFRRMNLPWTMAGLVLGLALAMPVLALNLELRQAPEMFGILRLLNSNNGNLSPFLASDLSDETVFFSDMMTRVYLTLHNLLGFASEPYLAVQSSGHAGPPGWTVWGTSSELRVYMGIIPIALGFMALHHWRDKRVVIVSVLTLFSLGLTMGFDPDPQFAPRSTQPLQGIFLTILPGTGLIEALQNTVGLFAFAMIMLAALGWSHSSKTQRRTALIVCTVIIAAKYLGLGSWEESLPYELTALGLTSVAAALGITIVIFAVSLRNKAPYGGLALIALLDVILFALALTNNTIDTTLQKEMAAAQVHRGDPNDRVPMYRPPFPTGHKLFRPEQSHGIAAPELLTYTSYGYGPPMLKYLGVHNQHFDQFFSTQSYYDFLANVSPDRQLDAVGVSAPVLRFYPKQAAVPAKNTGSAVKIMSSSPPAGLKDILVLEDGLAKSDKTLSREDVKRFFVRSEVSVSKETAREVYLQSQWRFPRHGSVQISQVFWTPEKLILDITVPNEGWLYWADGYSRHWRATVNGHSADIKKANINFKAVQVPAGSSRIEFAYDPLLIRYSMYIYFAAIGLYLLMAAAYGLRRLNKAISTQAPPNFP